MISQCSWLPLISAEHLGERGGGIHCGTRAQTMVLCIGERQLNDLQWTSAWMEAKWRRRTLFYLKLITRLSIASRDLAQLHVEYFPARRRVITPFCSTRPPTPPPLSSSFSHHFLSFSSLPFSFPLCGHRFLSFASPPRLFQTPCLLHLAGAPGHSYSDWFVFVSCLWLQHLETSEPWMVRRVFTR